MFQTDLFYYYICICTKSLWRYTREEIPCSRVCCQLTVLESHGLKAALVVSIVCVELNGEMSWKDLFGVDWYCNGRHNLGSFVCHPTSITLSHLSRVWKEECFMLKDKESKDPGAKMNIMEDGGCGKPSTSLPSPPSFCIEAADHCDQTL